MIFGRFFRRAGTMSLAAALPYGGVLGLLAPPDYVPTSIEIVSATAPAKGAVCVVGTSMQSGNVPAYYLRANGKKTADGKPQWVWAKAGANTKVVALPVGSVGASIISQPPSAANPYVNAGNIRFFFVAGAAAAQTCSKISYQFKDTAGDLFATYVPYPMGLLEVSSYPLLNKDGNTTSKVMTIDTSNVDSFQLPMQLSFTGIAANPNHATIGNPTDSPVMTRRNLITGPAGNGCASPFATWLNGRGPSAFQDLMQSSAVCDPKAPNPVYPVAMLLSPTDYLVAGCLDLPPNHSPIGCTLNGQLLHGPKSPLASYYDTELDTFFKNALGLVVMGDAHGAISEQAWQVSSTKADCPAYLFPDGASLDFVPAGTSPKAKSPTTITLCNPLNQLVYLDPPPTHYTQTGAVAHVDITKDQYPIALKMTGRNFGQPETGWVGVVDSFAPNKDGSYSMALKVLATPQAEVENPQKLCTTKTCGLANPSFPLWAFTNIRAGKSIDPFEGASRMVFGNDGVFSSWLYYKNKSDLMIVTQSIERNIAWAFTHGIANCNNITMAKPDSAPTYCKTLKPAPNVSTAASKASDAYWMNEANWYPDGGPQNYYAQYLHTAQVDAGGAMVPKTKPNCEGCRNIFVAPAAPISGATSSNQGVTMGMAYGFGFDENPDYLSALPTRAAQVPSKLDPIPSSFGTKVGVTLTIGASD